MLLDLHLKFFLGKLFVKKLFLDFPDRSLAPHFVFVTRVVGLDPFTQIFELLINVLLVDLHI